VRKPVVGDSRSREFCRKFVRFSEHWLVKNLVRPVIFIMPPSIITLVATRSGLQAQLDPLLGHKIVSLLNDSALLVLVFASLYVYLLRTIYSAIEHHSKPERELNRDDLNAMLNSLNVVVGDKMKRFSSYFRSIDQEKRLCGNDVFQNITQPRQQIGMLVAALRGVFEFIDSSDALFRVGLLIIKDDKPCEWAHFEPAEHPPRTEPSELANARSTVMHCIKAKSAVLVEDIAKELAKRENKQRYLRCNTGDGDNGSQLCIPVICPMTRKVIYVITIAADRKCALREKHLPLYRWIADNYTLRMTLEHSLLILKEKTNESTKAT
jgi:hypothetical protein